MNWKIALALFAAVTLAASFTLPGCGGDDCTRAADHKVECLPSTTSSTSTGGMAMEGCAGSLLCQSQCINQYTCEQINGMVQPFVACMQTCQGK